MSHFINFHCSLIISGKINKVGFCAQFCILYVDIQDICCKISQIKREIYSVHLSFSSTFDSFLHCEKQISFFVKVQNLCHRANLKKKLYVRFVEQFRFYCCSLKQNPTITISSHVFTDSESDVLNLILKIFSISFQQSVHLCHPY